MVRYTFPMLLEVIKYVRLSSFHFLPFRVFRKDHSIFEKWRILEGYDLSQLPQPVVLRGIYVSEWKMS